MTPHGLARKLIDSTPVLADMSPDAIRFDYKTPDGYGRLSTGEQQVWHITQAILDIGNRLDNGATHIDDEWLAAIGSTLSDLADELAIKTGRLS